MVDFTKEELFDIITEQHARISNVETLLAYMYNAHGYGEPTKTPEVTSGNR